jgi:pyruvate kinase
MLDSMMSAPRPTRAEVSDVANAVMDGADAVMLSGETSVGNYPVESVATMARIATAAEEVSLQATHHLERMPETTGGAIARAAAEVGAIVGAKALVAFTMSGDTARRLARYRSPIQLLAFTSAPEVRGQLALSWGVETFQVPFVHHTDDMVRQVESALLALGHCEKGDKVVIAAGAPSGSAGSTNSLRVHVIGQAVSHAG